MKPQMICSAAATWGPFLTLILSSQQADRRAKRDAMRRPGIPLPTRSISKRDKTPSSRTRFRSGRGGG